MAAFSCPVLGTGKEQRYIFCVPFVLGAAWPLLLPNAAVPSFKKGEQRIAGSPVSSHSLSSMYPGQERHQCRAAVPGAAAADADERLLVASLDQRKLEKSVWGQPPHALVS